MQSWADVGQCWGGKNQNTHGAPACQPPGRVAGTQGKDISLSEWGPTSLTPLMRDFSSFWRVNRWDGEKGVNISRLGWASHSLEVSLHEVLDYLGSWKADTLGSNLFQRIC